MTFENKPNISKEEICEPAEKRRRIPNTLYNNNMFLLLNQEAALNANPSENSTVPEDVANQAAQPGAAPVLRVAAAAPRGIAPPQLVAGQLPICSKARPTRIVCDSEFASFAEFKAEFDIWKRTYNHPFRVASSETLKDVDGTVDNVCHYRYIVYQCAHYGQPRKRGNGTRPNQNYLPCGCEAMLRICYNFKNKTLKITQLRQVHSGHTGSTVDTSDTGVKKEREVIKPKRRYSRRVYNTEQGPGSNSKQKRISEDTFSIPNTGTPSSSPEGEEKTPVAVPKPTPVELPTTPIVASNELHKFYNNLLTLYGKMPMATPTPLDSTSVSVMDLAVTPTVNTSPTTAMDLTPTSAADLHPAPLDLIRPTPVMATSLMESTMSPALQNSLLHMTSQDPLMTPVVTTIPTSMAMPTLSASLAGFTPTLPTFASSLSPFAGLFSTSLPFAASLPPFSANLPSMSANLAGLPSPCPPSMASLPTASACIPEGSLPSTSAGMVPMSASLPSTSAADITVSSPFTSLNMDFGTASLPSTSAAIPANLLSFAAQENDFRMPQAEIVQAGNEESSEKNNDLEQMKSVISQLVTLCDTSIFDNTKSSRVAQIQELADPSPFIDVTNIQ